MPERNGFLEEWWDKLKGRKEWHLLRAPGMGRLLVVLLGGILLLICTSSWVSPKPKASSTSVDQPSAVSNGGEVGLAKAEKDLEKRLEEILSSVAGSGEVQVTITMAAGPEHQYAKNTSQQNRTIEEKDQTGGNRMTTETNEDGDLVLVREVSGGKEEPVLIRATRPEIAGVLVLAEGARDPGLREELVQAVLTVLAVPAHKVTVLPKESR